MLAQPEIVVLPGVYDGLSARLAQRAGFGAIFTTGFGFSASALGQPDFGLMTMSETMDRVRNIVAAVSVPVVADMDTGYGNPLNVTRTVRECVTAGAAGIILEDQLFPKKCGHMAGKKVIPAEEHAAKLRAAIDARGGDDLVIIARTDARAPHGLDEAIRRGRLYRDAGADVIFVEAPQSLDELRAIKAAIPDAPLFANMVEGGKTPLLTTGELQALGFSMVVFPISALLAAAKAIESLYAELFAKKTTAGAIDRLTPFEEFERIVGVPELRALEERYGVD
jgi:methylisocitrate lyase